MTCRAVLLLACSMALGCTTTTPNDGDAAPGADAGPPACTPDTCMTYEGVDREPGVRAPVTSECNPLGSMRCLLPWPSSAFLVADPSSETGVHVQVTLTNTNSRDDGGDYLSHANGFSRVTSVVAGFEGDLSEEGLGGPLGGAVRLFVASPESPHYGEEVPLRIEVDLELSPTRVHSSALTGDPLETLEPNTEYVVVIGDGIRSTEGASYTAPHGTRLALGLDPAYSEEEAAVAGYHAPTRTLLANQGIDPEHVLRVWDFITRTEENATAPLLSMRDQSLAALAAGEVSVVIDTVEHRDSGSVASVLTGHLTGLPNWLDENQHVVRGADGLPMVMGTAEARFRVMIPRGTGDYRTVLYGHGAGGEVSDGSFDGDLADSGIAKVNVEFLGWTGDSIVQTLIGVSVAVMNGSNGAVSGLMQSAAHAVTIRTAVDTILGDALAADMLGGMANPHAGRRPGRDGTLWVGGSLGGTMGMVITSIDDGLRYGVLNVPGAAWAQWARDSLLLDGLIAPIRNRNGGELNVAAMVAMCQTLFDLVDGASFRRLAEENGDIFLIQESMGDPVLPNPGNEFVAISTDAVQVGAVLSPIHGLRTEATEVLGATGITQFQVASRGGTFDVHGFAAEQDTVAGQAAFEQIELFLNTTWDTGTSVIRVPSLCPGGSCDFSPP